jgi:cyclase
MLKLRVMPTLLYEDVGLVKGVRFDSWRRVGGVMQAVKVYNMREVDELVFLDIAATRSGREPDYELVDDIADECFMPLTVGGGIRTVEHVERLLKVGADKVAVNTATVDEPTLVSEIAEVFGSQCVVASVDVANRDGRAQVMVE